MFVAERPANQRQSRASVREAERPKERDDVPPPGRCQRSRIRIAGDEPLVRREDQIRAGALQEKLSDQHAVGLGPLTPWELAAVLVEPFEYAPA